MKSVMIINYRDSTYYKLSVRRTKTGKRKVYIENLVVRQETTHKNPTYVNVTTRNRYYIFNKDDYFKKIQELDR